VHCCSARALPCLRDKFVESRLAPRPAADSGTARRTANRCRVARRSPVIVVFLFCHCRHNFLLSGPLRPACSHLGRHSMKSPANVRRNQGFVRRASFPRGASLWAVARNLHRPRRCPGSRPATRRLSRVFHRPGPPDSSGHGLGSLHPSCGETPDALIVLRSAISSWVNWLPPMRPDRVSPRSLRAAPFAARRCSEHRTPPGVRGPTTFIR
jgi:hypothetical protein